MTSRVFRVSLVKLSLQLASSASSELSDTDSHSKSSGDRSDAEFEEPVSLSFDSSYGFWCSRTLILGQFRVKLMERVLFQATLQQSGALQLDVSENFSWAEDVERSYSESVSLFWFLF